MKKYIIEEIHILGVSFKETNVKFFCFIQVERMKNGISEEEAIQAV